MNPGLSIQLCLKFNFGGKIIILVTDSETRLRIQELQKHKSISAIFLQDRGHALSQIRFWLLRKKHPDYNGEYVYKSKIHLFLQTIVLPWQMPSISPKLSIHSKFVLHRQNLEAKTFRFFCMPSNRFRPWTEMCDGIVDLHWRRW